jgi:hypothetical protein
MNRIRMFRHITHFSRHLRLLLLFSLVAACSRQPVIEQPVSRIQGDISVDFTGSWERDYSRGDDVNSALNRAYAQLRGYYGSASYSNDSRGGGGPTISQSEVNSLIALARLGDLITRPDFFTILQTKHDLSIERDDDFAIFCEFYNGASQGTFTEYGNETCGWDGETFVTHLVLPDGLVVNHRFTTDTIAERMRVITTMSSTGTRVPFTVHRYYRKFEPPEAEFNCIETLSKNRVCSTSDEEIIP